MTTRKVSLAIACESPLLERGLRDMLAEIREFSLVGSARDAACALEMLRADHPDVLLIDATLMSRLSRLVTRADPRPRILVLSYRAHAGTDLPCGRGCACAFAQPKVSEQHLRTLLRTLAACDERTSGSSRCANCPAQDSLRPPPLPLSAREQEIFLRIGHGESNRIIAAALGVSVKTIETHRENIKRKLGLASAHALVEAAVRWRCGDIELGDAERSMRSRPRAAMR
ncbi:MAG TPA: response regulator transcription factor [Xanthomonadaceae bacterium]|nr:response regulator transcription factor [Xanthomonadaceae bacterium]